MDIRGLGLILVLCLVMIFVVPAQAEPASPVEQLATNICSKDSITASQVIAKKTYAALQAAVQTGNPMAITMTQQTSLLATMAYEQLVLQCAVLQRTAKEYGV